MLQAVAARPTARKIAADKAGVAVTDRGFIPVDIQMRTNVPHIFAIGDIVGQPMLAHKAVHEAHVAAEVIAGELQGNKNWPAPPSTPASSPAWPTPTPKWPGWALTERPGQGAGHPGQEGPVPLDRLRPRHCQRRDEGFTKLLFDDQPRSPWPRQDPGRRHRGTHAGDMIGEIALAIEMGADAVDIGKTIHPHPTLGESIGMAAEVARTAAAPTCRQRANSPPTSRQYLRSHGQEVPQAPAHPSASAGAATCIARQRHALR